MGRSMVVNAGIEEMISHLKDDNSIMKNYLSSISGARIKT